VDAAMATTRRLAAILASDVAGYSRLMAADEEGTYERLRAHLAELVHPKIAEHRGRLFKNTGDGFLAEFASVVDAVRCAVEMQLGVSGRNAGIAPADRIEFRIGVNVGDIIAEEHDIFGDGVNVAARLEALADPGGICISGTVLDHIGDRLPYAFLDMGAQSVKNIARPVHVYRILVGVESRASTRESAVGPALSLPDKPSIAVLPFQNISGDPEQEYFADGMVEEIITALSRIRWLFVVARNSSFTYKGQAVDVKQVGRELGVRYVLEGSVRKARGRVRITAQLIEATTGAHLWADRFEGSLEAVFDLQDNVAASIAGVIEPTVQVAEIRLSAARPTSDLTAYDLYLRALSIGSSYEKDHLAQALDLLEQAIAREPRYGPALAQAAAYRVDLENYDWDDDREGEENRRVAVELSRQAVVFAPNDAGVLGRAAVVLGRFGGDIDAALALMDRALVLNPSFAHAWYWSGWLRLFAGKAELAIQHFETSMRLNPRAQRCFHLSGIGMAHFLDGRLDAALAALRVALEEGPTFTPTYRTLAACYAHMGRLDEARSVIKRMTSLTPVLEPSVNPLRDPHAQELFRVGLRLAAGEET
jgi:pentatricopeptide repeat protein